MLGHNLNGIQPLHSPAVPGQDGIQEPVPLLLVHLPDLVPLQMLLKLVVEGFEGLLRPIAKPEALVAAVLTPPSPEELLQVTLHEMEFRRVGDHWQSSVAGTEVLDVLLPALLHHHEVVFNCDQFGRDLFGPCTFVQDFDANCALFTSSKTCRFRIDSGSLLHG